MCFRAYNNGRYFGVSLRSLEGIRLNFYLLTVYGLGVYCFLAVFDTIRSDCMDACARGTNTGNYILFYEHTHVNIVPAFAEPDITVSYIQ